MVFLNTSADNRDVIAGYITAWAQLRQLPAQNVEGILEALQAAGWLCDQLAMQTEGFMFSSSELKKD